MPDAPVLPPRDHPLMGRKLAVSDGRLTVRPAPPASRHVLRCKPGDAAYVGKALGITLPVQACRSTVSGQSAALWLGPDEWLLIAGYGDARPRVEGVAMSLVDVSHRSIALEVKGEGAEDVLTSACPLDLHSAAFPPGSCVRTLFGNCEIALWRKAVDAFWLDVARSHADYVWRLLEVACTDATDIWETLSRPTWEPQDRAGNHNGGTMP
jgi:sarcosine oxidase, subunit gamma